MANDESLWPDHLEATGSFTGLTPGPFFLENLEQFDNSFPLDVGNATDATSSTESPQSEMSSGIEYLSRTGQPDFSLQLFHNSRSQLSHGVLYNDTHHKFGPVLSLCELSQNRNQSRQNSRLTYYRRRRILHYTVNHGLHCKSVPGQTGNCTRI